MSLQGLGLAGCGSAWLGVVRQGLGDPAVLRGRRVSCRPRCPVEDVRTAYPAVMSGELHVVVFSVVVEDASRWPSWARERAEAAGAGDDTAWALSGLEETMREAGVRYIEQHPELFRSELV